MPLVTVEEFSKVLASVQLWFCRSIGIHLCVTAQWALLLQYALHLHPFVYSNGRFLWRPMLFCRESGVPLHSLPHTSWNEIDLLSFLEFVDECGK